MPRWLHLPLFFSLISGLGTLPAPAQDENLKPTWETQRQARTYLLGIPAPRGQISDRNGEPLAQTRLCYNLGISFPTPLDSSNAGAIAFARQQLAIAERLLNRRISVSDEAIARHYGNRGVLPLDIAQDLTEAERDRVKSGGGDGLTVHPVYVRCYPNGALAAHILGYAGRAGRPLDGPIENNELLWPEAVGRDGLELTFNEQLTGKPGQMTLNFDAKGKRAPERVSIAPEPGYNVVTTLDVHLQRLCEKALAAGCKRGAMVFMDPNNGDILAMASWPSFDPNVFIPVISPEQFKALNTDPNIPLLPRAFRSAYPPGSTFKVFVGIAALESGAITLDQEFPGPPSMQIGNRVMRNWKKEDAGMLNLAGAIEQSCDTWFYQVGIKTGAAPIVDWAQKFGFSAKTGIPLWAEAEGRVPTNEYMKKVYGRKLMDGDMANMSIGQGDTLVTPLQMAQAMATVANGGTFYQTRLVKQVQSLDDKVVSGYDLRVKDQLPIKAENMEALRNAMVAVVTGGHGTAHRAAVDNVEVAGKTGTAQWGPEKNERNAAWFAGFAPARQPKYAFAVIYESDPGQKDSHGGTVAAPLVGQVLRELYPTETKAQRKKGRAEAAKLEEPKPTPTPEPKEDSGD
ncbi:MAG: penicillin-binding protein 2 [Verrucomicrobiota bacterium]